MSLSPIYLFYSFLIYVRMGSGIFILSYKLWSVTIIIYFIVQIIEIWPSWASLSWLIWSFDKTLSIFEHLLNL